MKQQYGIDTGPGKAGKAPPAINLMACDDDVFYLSLQKQKSAQSYIPQGYFTE
jgi:hypothetical protein